MKMLSIIDLLIFNSIILGIILGLLYDPWYEKWIWDKQNWFNKKN